MTTYTNTATRNQTSVGYETSKFALGVGISAAALIGVWASACMISALMNHTVAEIAKGLLGAMGAL